MEHMGMGARTIQVRQRGSITLPKEFRRKYQVNE
jgi:bifunctional DNA-binding transcriptional regulator/antitoxin component of YhaV-PrlF toxin-antitoxin module